MVLSDFQSIMLLIAVVSFMAYVSYLLVTLPGKLIHKRQMEELERLKKEIENASLRPVRPNIPPPPVPPPNRIVSEGFGITTHTMARPRTPSELIHERRQEQLRRLAEVRKQKEEGIKKSPKDLYKDVMKDEA